MSEASAAPDPQPLDAPSRSAHDAAAALRRVREDKGVHLVALAAALKVPMRHLERLESGDWQDLPDPVFAKALAASVCRHIGVDDGAVMQHWPQLQNPTLARAQVLPPHRAMAFDPYPNRPSRWRQLSLALLVTLALAGLAWLWWSAGLPKAQEPVENGGASALEAPGSAAIRDVASSSKPEVGNVGTRQEVSEIVQPTSATAPSAAQAGVVQPPGESTPTSVEPARAGVSWQLGVKQPSWVEIRHARDGVVLSRVLQAGENLSWPLGNGAWSVVLGNAAGVSVTVDGQSRDLGGDTRANVARFTLE